MPIPLIALAGSLIQAAPAIAKWIGGGKAEEVAGKVLDVAKAVTGVESPDQAASIIFQDPAAAAAFQEALANLEADLDKAYLSDVQDARKRDISLAQLGQGNWRANILVGMTFLVVFTLMTLIWSFPEVNDYVKGTATLLVGRFLGYLDNIFNFEFGTTRTSKAKDAAILNLTK